MLPEADVARVITVLASLPKYVPNFWEACPVAITRDSHVFYRIVQGTIPDLSAVCYLNNLSRSKHFQQQGIMPETFCKKWFAPLCINVLPFDLLFRFFELFLEHGHLYLLKFALSLVTTLKQKILSSVDYQIYEILRFDKLAAITPETKFNIINQAVTIDISKYNIEQLRKQCYEIDVKHKIKDDENNNKEKDNEEDDEEDDGDDSEGSGVECELCTKMSPDVYCKDCKKLMCENCLKVQSSLHTKSHVLDENWEKYQKEKEEADRDEELIKGMENLNV
jgi:hypothetical protein